MAGYFKVRARVKGEIHRPYPDMGKNSLKQVIPFSENCRRLNPSENAEGMVTSQLNTTEMLAHLPSLPTLKTWTLGRKWTKRGLSSYTNGSGSLWLPIDSVSMTTRSRDASILQLHPLRCVCVSTPFYPLLKARRVLWVAGDALRGICARWESAESMQQRKATLVACSSS